MSYTTDSERLYSAPQIKVIVMESSAIMNNTSEIPSPEEEELAD